MNQIKVFVKEPGMDPVMEYIDNTLEELQGIVCGCIEVVQISSDSVIICNEEGMINNLPYNCRMFEQPLFGTIIFAGAKGEEFCDFPGGMALLHTEFRSVFPDRIPYTADAYQLHASRTMASDWGPEKKLYHAVFGLCSEAGEVAGILQKKYQGHIVDPEHIKKELGDCCWFIAEACEALGVSLEDVMRLNIEKLKARFPEGFEPEKSLHRKAGDI